MARAWTGVGPSEPISPRLRKTSRLRPSAEKVSMTSYPPRRVDEGEQLHASQVVQACLLRRGVGPPNRARRDAAGLVLEAIASLGQEMERDQEPMMDDTHAESDTA